MYVCTNACVPTHAHIHNTCHTDMRLCTHTHLFGGHTCVRTMRAETHVCAHTMCVCVYVCTHVCVCVSTCARTHNIHHAHTHTLVHTYTHLFCLCTHVRTTHCTNTHVCTQHVCVCVHKHVCVCAHVRAHTTDITHTHMLVHTYTHLFCARMCVCTTRAPTHTCAHNTHKYQKRQRKLNIKKGSRSNISGNIVRDRLGITTNSHNQSSQPTVRNHQSSTMHDKPPIINQ